MTLFSANLGFLWTDLPLTKAIAKARIAGFDAVECHWPYGDDVKDINESLLQTGLAMLCINTRPGDRAAGDNGLSALPERKDEALIAIDEAIDYAARINCKNVHVMAGIASGAAAHSAFVSNLQHACARGASHGITILIEPLNTHDAPGYFLNDLKQACAIQDEIDADNLKLMFDCYHVARIHGDVITQLERHIGRIGHIQFAGVPNRGRPDEGTLDYKPIFQALAEHGYKKPLGAEYKPNGDTDASLGWMETLRR